MASQKSIMKLVDSAKSFGHDLHAVEALSPTSVTVRLGDYLAVMGPSGSGKSTMLNLMGLLVRPTAGHVEVSGRDTSVLTDDGLSALRGELLGFVFQSFHLLPTATALENVELPLVYARVERHIRRIRAREILHRVEMAHREHAMAGELSGGERQRVAIARAVIRQPAVLLCDEPTGNLDSRSAEKVMALLDEMNHEGMTIVLVTHDQAVAGHARRLLLLKDGVATESALPW
jgi:putative ABC transport system ATP-binding protein